MIAFNILIVIQELKYILIQDIEGLTETALKLKNVGMMKLVLEDLIRMIQGDLV